MNSTTICRHLPFMRLSKGPVNYLRYQKCSSRVEIDSSKIVVALSPEFLTDNHTNNPAMVLPRDKNKRQIIFDNLTEENVFRGLVKNSVLYKATLAEISSDEYLDKTSLKDVFKKLHNAMTNLNFSFKLLSLCFCLNPERSSYQAMQDVERTVQGLLSKRFTPELYRFVGQSQNREDLTSEERSLLIYYAQECERHGCHLKGNRNQLRIRDFLLTLIEKEKAFFDNVVKMPEELWVKIDDPEVLKSLPESLLQEGIQVDKLTLPALPHIYQLFITTCSNRTLRNKFWYAYNNRAGFKVADYNSIILDELRENRQRLAKLCGYPNYAEMSIVDKMAGNVEKAKSMIDILHTSVKPYFEKDLEKLRKLFKELYPLAKDDLQLWDIPYLSQLYQTRSMVKKIDNSRYLSYDKILTGIFKWIKKVFNITIEEVECKSKPTPYTTYFQVIDHDLQDEVVGNFYLDLYASGKMYNRGPEVIDLLSRCKSSSTTPLVYLLINKKAPAIDGGEVILNQRDFLNIVSGIGHVLTTICNRESCLDLSSMASMPRDHANWFANLLLTFVNHDYSLTEHCTMDRLKKTPLAKDRFELLRQNHIAFKSTLFIEQLFLSALDLALHVNEEYWKDVMDVVWKRYMTPLSMPRAYNFPLSFSDLGQTKSAATVYASIWSQVIAADCFMKFKEAEEEGIDIGTVGRDFKKKVLYSSSPLKGAQIFRDFRGRDPSADPLLELYGFLGMSDSLSEPEESSVKISK